MTTVRELVEELSAFAPTLPDGMDTQIKVGICDGENLQIVQQVDIGEWFHQELGSTEAETFILIRAHHHPGEESGLQARGVTVDVDEEARKLAEE